MLGRFVRTLSLLLLLPPAAQASLLQMNVFGDSLSGTGNLFALSGGLVPPAPAYFEGRFSNGPNWVDQVGTSIGAGPVNNVFDSMALGDGINNLAVGGAYTGTFPFPVASQNSTDLRLSPPAPVFPGLQQQVATYAALTGDGVLVDPAAWHVLWAGANDILFAPIVIAPTAAAMQAVATEAVANIGGAVGDLYDLGAREFMIFNLPDIGATPFGAGSGLAPLLSLGSAVFNAQLDALLASLPGSHPGIRLTLLDADALFAELLADVLVSPQTMARFPDAQALPFVPPGLSFCFDQDALFATQGGPFFCTGDDPDDRIFHDLVHPSSRTHALIAAAVLDAKVAEPATLWILVLGLLGIGARVRNGVAVAGIRVRITEVRCGLRGP